MTISEDWRRLVTLGRLWRKRPRRGVPPEYSAPPVGGRLCYVITAQAQHTIEAHAQAYRGEVGGVLLGEVYEEQGRYLVSVTAALPARYTVAGMIYLTFTGWTWLDLIARRQSYPDSKMVGWYHSHPGLGVFLSGSDRFIHRSFFGDQPWYLALVIDPLTGEQGVFGWDEDRIVPCPGQVALAPLAGLNRRNGP